MGLVERADQLAALRSLFAGCQQGKSRIVMISGGVATGKSTLLRTMTEYAAQAGAFTLGAVASAAENNVSLGVVEQLFRSPGLPAEYTERAMYWLNGSVPVASASGPEVVSSPAIRRLWEIIKDLTDRAPTVIGVDGAHYADEASLLCLLYAVRRLRSARLLIILTRCERAWTANYSLQNDFLREPNSRHITLKALSADGVQTMLARNLGETAAKQLAPEFHAASGGHPTLVQALIRDQLAASRLVPPGAVPGETFSRAMLDFLNGHEPPVTDVAQAIAMLGGPVPPDLLGRLLSADTGSVEQAVGILTSVGLLENRAYRHEAVQAAVVTGAAPELRRTMHDRAAELLHSEGAAVTEVADHVVRSNGRSAHWAVPVLSDAAEQALSVDDTDAALRYLRTAHQMGTEPRQRSLVTAALALVEWRLDPGVALRRIPELNTAIGAGVADERGMDEAIVQLLWNGRVDEAREIAGIYRKNLDAAPFDAQGSTGLGAAQGWLAYLYPELYSGTFATTPGDACSPAPGSVAPGSLAQADVMTYLAGLRTTGPENNVAAARQVLECCRLSGRTVALLLMALTVMINNDLLTEAVTRCDVLHREAARRHSPTWLALFTAMRSLIHLRCGELAAAAEQARTALTVIPPRSWGVAAGLPIACAVRAKTAMGQLTDAAALLDLPVPGEMFHTPMGLHYLYARGEFNLAFSRPDAALHDFRNCGTLATNSALDPAPTEPWRIGAARAHLSLGAPLAARRITDEQLSRSAPGQVRTRGHALRVLAATHEPRERPALLEEALRLLRDCGDLFGIWRVTAELSDTFGSLGHGERSHQLAQEAQAIAGQCLDPASGRAEDDGASQLTCPAPLASLSDAEQRVATLAADGFTNREISQELYVTVSTVEQHLTKIYRKLHVSRPELHSAIHESSHRDGPRRPGGHLPPLLA